MQFGHLFFSQASEWGEILNPQILLANHALMTSPAFYDTAYRPYFFLLYLTFAPKRSRYSSIFCLFYNSINS